MFHDANDQTILLLEKKEPRRPTIWNILFAFALFASLGVLLFSSKKRISTAISSRPTERYVGGNFFSTRPREGDNPEENDRPGRPRVSPPRSPIPQGGIQTSPITTPDEEDSESDPESNPGSPDLLQKQIEKIKASEDGIYSQYDYVRIPEDVEREIRRLIVEQRAQGYYDPWLIEDYISKQQDEGNLARSDSIRPLRSPPRSPIPPYNPRNEPVMTDFDTNSEDDDTQH